MDDNPPAPRPGKSRELFARAEGRRSREPRSRFLQFFTATFGAIAPAHGAPPAEQTLSTTALVHETYLKLSRGAGWSAKDRSHFFSLSGRAMRMILVDQARSRTRQRRGSGRRPLDLDNVEIPVEERAAEIVALDEALVRLGEVDGELAQIVEWRFSSELSVERSSRCLGHSGTFFVRGIFWQQHKRGIQS